MMGTTFPSTKTYCSSDPLPEEILRLRSRNLHSNEYLRKRKRHPLKNCREKLIARTNIVSPWNSWMGVLRWREMAKRMTPCGPVTLTARRLLSRKRSVWIKMASSQPTPSASILQDRMQSTGMAIMEVSSVKWASSCHERFERNCYGIRMDHDNLRSANLLETAQK